jgi:hypothetical protein
MDRAAHKLQKLRARDWQIHQAIANLVLSRGICSGSFHYSCVQKTEMAETVITAARRYVESSTDPDKLAGITPELVAKQIELDIRYLLKANDISAPSGDLSKLQAKLVATGYC